MEEKGAIPHFLKNQQRVGSYFLHFCGGNARQKDCLGMKGRNENGREMSKAGKTGSMFDVQSSNLKVPPSRGAKGPRARYLLALDAAMLVLACVLEVLSLTGLQWHEWLGFVLCALVLLHVILQWPWFVAGFRRLFTRGATRARVNMVLNFLLFSVMVAVLVSGVLISNQVGSVVGLTLGRPRVWDEMHSWLNFTLIVLVGVHLAMNWDWVLGAIRRRTVPLVRAPGVRGFLFRGTVVLIVVGLVGGGAYGIMARIVKPNRAEKRMLAQMAAGTEPQPRQERGQSVREGLQELVGTVSFVIVVALVGRFVLRIRL